MRKRYNPYPSSGDELGWACAINGDWAAVGAPCDDGNSGHTDCGSVVIYKRNGNDWVQTDEIDEESFRGTRHFFGKAIAINGDYMVIGAPAYHLDMSGDNTGWAYVYKRTGDEWIFQQRLVGDDSEIGDAFGFGVAVQDPYIIVTANYDDDKGMDAGAAYGFKRSGETWSFMNKMLPPENGDFQHFGRRADISSDFSGRKAIISADWEAYIFGTSGYTWGQQAVLDPCDSLECCPDTAAIDGPRAVVGHRTYWDGVDTCGGIFLYEHDPYGSGWNLDRVLSRPYSRCTELGVWVDIDGDTIIGGAWNGGPEHQGAAYVYRYVEPSITVLAPAAGDDLLAGTPCEIRWTTQGLDGNDVKLEYRALYGHWHIHDIATVPNTGSYQWIAPSEHSQICAVIVRDAEDPDHVWDSSEVFSVYQIRLLSPNGGQVVRAGDPLEISWISDPSLNYVDVVFSDGNSVFVDPCHPNNGYMSWPTPLDANSPNCTIELTSFYLDHTAWDVSEAPFTVYQCHPELLIADVDGDQWTGWLDFETLAGAWLELECDEPDWCDGADTNRDHQVTYQDYSDLAAEWETCGNPFR